MTDLSKLIQHYKNTYENTTVPKDYDIDMKKCNVPPDKVELTEHEILLLLSLLTSETNFPKVKDVLYADPKFLDDIQKAWYTDSPHKENTNKYDKFQDLKQRFSSLFYSNPMLISQFKSIQTTTCPNCKGSLAFSDNRTVSSCTYLPLEYYIRCLKCSFFVALKQPLAQHLVEQNN
ncbi:hypothetical protein CN918_30295 [Priestia megaterium]|nr:hypothetical protein CN918_30295 [Priestia megaterium]